MSLCACSAGTAAFCSCSSGPLTCPIVLAVAVVVRAASTCVEHASCRFRSRISQQRAVPPVFKRDPGHRRRQLFRLLSWGSVSDGSTWSSGAAVVPLLVVPILIARVDICELPRVEGAAGADDRDVDPRSRSQGSVHGGSCATRRDVLRVRRLRVRLRATADGTAALRRADARHRQARRSQPDPQQARPTHRGGVRAREAARVGIGRVAASDRLPCPRRW